MSLRLAEIERTRLKRTPNLPVYDYYLRAWQNLQQSSTRGVDEALRATCVVHRVGQWLLRAKALYACALQLRKASRPTEAERLRTIAALLHLADCSDSNLSPMVRHESVCAIEEPLQRSRQ